MMFSRLAVYKVKVEQHQRTVPRSRHFRRLIKNELEVIDRLEPNNSLNLQL